jgi:LemA protein
MKFNETTRTYNVYTRKFPARIFASLYGFEQKPYFKAQEGAEKVPEVKF